MKVTNISPGKYRVTAKIGNNTSLPIDMRVFDGWGKWLDNMGIQVEMGPAYVCRPYLHIDFSVEEEADMKAIDQSVWMKQ